MTFFEHSKPDRKKTSRAKRTDFNRVIQPPKETYLALHEVKCLLNLLIWVPTKSIKRYQCKAAD